MTIDIDVAILQQRIATAEAARDTWRSCGMQEHYLEACSTVDALNLQLDELERSAKPRLTL